jgi:hypothetical protein
MLMYPADCIVLNGNTAFLVPNEPPPNVDPAKSCPRRLPFKPPAGVMDPSTGVVVPPVPVLIAILAAALCES